MKILDLKKWNSQTTESVKHALDKADAPCIGFSLVFMDYRGPNDVEWKFKSFLAFDPHNPPPKEERDKLEAIFKDRAGIIAAIFDQEESSQLRPQDD